MKHALAAELYYDGSWHDMTSAGEVYRSLTVTTRRYGAGLTAKMAPGATRLSLEGSSGKYNPANPASPLYGLVGINTPMRISCGSSARWTGEAAEWKPVRPIGAPRRTEVTGGGILRRLGIGTAPIMSALTSGILAMSPAIYLPLTDGPLATVGGTPIPLGRGIAADGITFGQIDGPPGDNRKTPEMVGDEIGGASAYQVTLPTPTGSSWCIDLAVRAVRKTGVYNNFQLLSWVTGAGTTSEINWQIGITWNTPDSSDSIRVFGYKTIGADSVTADLNGQVVMDGAWHHYRIQSVHTSGTTEVWVTLDDAHTGYGSATLPASGVSSIGLVSASNAFLTSGSVAHVAVYDDEQPGSSWLGFRGRPGELAADRFTRVCLENGITSSVIGTPATDSHPMGPQLTAPLLDVLHDCAVTDGGLLYESASVAGLTLRCFGAMCRQTPALVVDIDTDITPPLDMTIGDRPIRNDVTARRVSGSSARYELTTGRLSTQAPPNGVGRYDTNVDVNPAADSSLGDIAAWLVTLGTTEGVQYGRVVLDLDANPTLDLSDVEIGTLIELTGIPAYDDPETPRLIIMGIEETIGTHRRQVTLLTTLAKPYDVGYLDSGGYLDCGGTTASEALDATETGVDVTITDTCSWTHADGNYDVVIGGERMTVTAVSAVSGAYPAMAQTLTVTRSVNGVVKSHAAGAEIHVHDPLILSL